MKIVVAPGAFKHSLSAAAAAAAIERGLRRSGLGAQTVLLPMADGGNGTLDAFLAQGGQRRSAQVLGPLGQPLQADIALLDDGTAVVEMALASGLELLPPAALDPLRATTYGTGQLLRLALETGAERIIIGMGGSATVDGGAGCLQALGVRLLDRDGHEIPRGGGGLAGLAAIDIAGLDPRWQEVDLLIASDVQNPALGPQGAAAVFGPQKGASAADVETLEAGLQHFFTQVAQQLGVDVRQTPGGGAAGAFAAGLMAFLGGRIQSGIELVLAHNHFVQHLHGALLVVTGEGQMDEQTVYGKGPIGVARLAREHGVPTVALVGGLNADDALLHEAGIHAVLPLVTGPMSLERALAEAEALLERAALRLGYLLALRGP